MISSHTGVETLGPMDESAPDDTGIDLLARFCVIDHWYADLSSAFLCMGDHAKRFHGFDPNRERFGLLEYLCCYDERCRGHIVSLFEYAASSDRPFHFSATLDGSCGPSRIVQCFGAKRRTDGIEELFGTFIFSRTLYVDL